MKTFFHTIILLCCAIFLTGCSEELIDKTQMGTIRGTVVKAGSNEPLANVKVYTAPTTQTVFTGADGGFVLEQVPIGDYTVKAELKGYVLNIQAANLKSDGQVISVVFEMKDDASLNSPPSVPQLTAPADNAVDQPLSVTLSWTATDPDKDDELTYKLIVKNNKNNDIKTVENIKDKKYTLENLEFGTSYFWQIAVSDGVNPEVFSAVNRFTTAAVPPNRFHYVQTVDGNSVIRSSDENGPGFLLTTSNYNSFRPRKSNASGLIAFLRTTGGNTQIFTVKPDGSEAYQVTRIGVAGFNQKHLTYSWSGNGKELLYANYDKLYRINKDGSGLELVYQTTDGSMISECDWSSDGSKIALKTNNSSGYNVKIFVIDMLGNVLTTVLSGVQGAAGGLNFSVDGSKLIYTHDLSGYQSADYRQLETHIFLYKFADGTRTDLSLLSKITAGTIDIDPRFSPNEAQIIFTNTSNDGISQRNVYIIDIADADSRKLLFNKAEMPDWE
ncbi:MAG: hypothetical protein EAS48_09750 [Chryseobacterium sp.]|nr:MAG: hypothetical protein EAS48_09750 [Chryseobacterium sp.]